jgi:hypothetical protein
LLDTIGKRGEKPEAAGSKDNITKTNLPTQIDSTVGGPSDSKDEVKNTGNSDIYQLLYN